MKKLLLSTCLIAGLTVIAHAQQTGTNRDSSRTMQSTQKKTNKTNASRNRNNSSGNVNDRMDRNDRGTGRDSMNRRNNRTMTDSTRRYNDGMNNRGNYPDTTMPMRRDSLQQNSNSPYRKSL